jgi:peptidoglycan hydrolase-like protein with peptidoglycan-binding domain
MATIYDAVDVAAIPASATIVGAYVDGAWPTAKSPEVAAMRARGVYVVTISVNGSTLDADVIDIEPGNISIAGGVDWCARKIARSERPVVYASRSWVPQIQDALRAHGIAVSAVDYWVADWTGSPHLVPGSVATQYANPPASGGNYDLSITNGSWPIPTPTPTPTPSPDRTCTVTLRILSKGSHGGDVRSLQRLLRGGLAVDGVFGDATDAAVRNFQRTNHLGIDGVVGSATWTTLIAVG